ncbi:hypothetical protein ACFWBV_07390 [Streptomyces sp. NPDC060030]|uniref:hypothetical protein n=1 Tax=Streptomyces sp. NPDC060030 TaxID=3347042 RepID=UPI0036A61EC7
MTPRPRPGGGVGGTMIRAAAQRTRVAAVAGTVLRISGPAMAPAVDAKAAYASGAMPRHTMRLGSVNGDVTATRG